MLRRIDRIILPVPALPGAVRYYRDVLGLPLLREEKQRASFLMADGVTQLVLRADSEQSGEEIYYLVEDVRDLYTRREQLQLKFVQPPRQAPHGYRAAVKDPFGNVLLLLDRSTPAGAKAAVEDAGAPAVLFAGVEVMEPQLASGRDLLIQIYQQIGRTADDLPYTPQFEELYRQYSARQDGPRPTRRQVWRYLLNLRKGGKLPRLGEAGSESPQISPDAEQALRRLLKNQIGQIGKRDRLPYTERFDRLVDDFNKPQPRPLGPHLVWRLVAKLAK
jgi:catechol 2,3-dioxygenase-like lactoylglutathione lyase family enzyme